MANATSKVRTLHAQTLGTRLVWAAIGVGATGVLGIARMLTPAVTGVGTHTQLGLPPCGFLWLTGLPCPACGLTTAFAHLARWQWEPAVAANPLGIPLFLLVAVAVPVGVLGALRAWPLTEMLRRLALNRVLYALVFAGLLNWLSRLFAIWLA